jgi:hypothetical protein
LPASGYVSFSRNTLSFETVFLWVEAKPSLSQTPWLR